MRLMLLLLLPACSGTSEVDSADAVADFCSSIDDRDQTVVEQLGGNASSGNLEIRLLTDAVTDPHDPMYTAFKSYTLENTQSQGVQTTGETTGDGLVHELLGAGPWLFRAAYTRGSRICTAELAVTITANTTTHGCAVLTCPAG